MNQYPNVGPGLKKMFIAQIGAVICTVIALIPIIGIIGSIGAIVFAIISLVGLNGAGKDIPGCKTAFTLTIVELVVSIVGSFVSSITVLNLLFTIANDILSFFIIYYVCNSVSEVLIQMNAGEIADRGLTVWKISMGCYIASIVISILSIIPLLNVLASIAGFVVAIISLVVSILYMIFLNKSYHVFGA